MKAHRSFALLVLLAPLAAAFASCAKGNSNATGAGGSGGDITSVGGSGGGGTGGSMSHGMIGDPCGSQADCMSGKCTTVGAHKYCSQPCPPVCPTGTYCGLVEGDPMCLPDLGQQCAQCKTATDCKAPTDECLTAPLGDRFCARDCTTMGDCPNGFTCTDVDEYPPMTMVDAGAGDGGDAGMSDAGGMHPSGKPYKFCVPNGTSSCPCNTKRDGVEHGCFITNNFGKCGGLESCDGKAGMWKGCSAKTPAAESCNGTDDNCDMQVDNGDPNDLCSSQGPKPAHASWACNAAKCELGPCDKGYVAFPPGPAKDGCQCQQEAGEPNDTCANAKYAGTVADSGGNITLSGTLSSANDVDVWSFDSTDVDEVTNNSYHVAIHFTAPAANNEFQMDVIRSASCVDAPSGAGTNITDYDWCVNASDATPQGEAGCGATAAVHCADHSSKYFVRVHRKAGATGTCATYSISVTAAGGVCDLSKKCMP
jgi:hypothetical protein